MKNYYSNISINIVGYYVFGIKFYLFQFRNVFILKSYLMCGKCCGYFGIGINLQVCFVIGVVFFLCNVVDWLWCWIVCFCEVDVDCYDK